MIGRDWTQRSAIVRSTAILPILCVPLFRFMPTHVPMAIGVALLLSAIGWSGFVFARVALNQHHRDSATPLFRPRSSRGRSRVP